MDLLDSYRELFSRHVWELFVTCRPPPNMPINQVHNQLIKDVLRPIAKTSKDTIGAITIILPATTTSQLHSHSLLLSKKGSLLSNIDLLLFTLNSTKSVIRSHRDSVDIIPFRFSCQPDHKGHAMYSAENIASNDNYQIFTYGSKLLGDPK